MLFDMTCVKKEFINIIIENNTWACKDMKFIFECSTRYLTSKRSKRVRY